MRWSSSRGSSVAISTSSPSIRASIVASPPLSAYERCTEGKVSKAQFAQWLIPILAAAWQSKRTTTETDPT